MENASQPAGAERVLVTGALGCIGAWVTRTLVRDGAQVVAFDLGANRSRLELVMTPDELGAVQFARGDITDRTAVADCVTAQGINHIIHLAALQVPFCKADPVAGAQVNVVGTVNVFEAAKAAGLRQVIYASSIAVYGPAGHYADAILPADAPLFPQTHYGVYKQANEGTARIFWQDDGIASVALRPYTIYGPARDQGLTSEPTKAMLAAARGDGYHIPFGGVMGYQHVEDVARIFVQAMRTPVEGAHAFNLRGAIADMPTVIAAIEAAAPDVAGRISYDEVSLPFPEGFDDQALRAALGDIPDTSLVDGVAKTVDHFRAALADGRLA